jgi:hypothetical protein
VCCVSEMYHKYNDTGVGYLNSETDY